MKKSVLNLLIFLGTFFVFGAVGLYLDNPPLILTGFVLSFVFIFVLAAIEDRKNKTGEIHKYIKKRIEEKATKQAIEKEVVSKFKFKYASRLVQDYAELTLKERYSTMNHVLIGILIILTVLKIISFISIIQNDMAITAITVMLLFISAINIYLIYAVHNFRAHGYFVTIILLAYSLLNESELIMNNSSSQNTLVIGSIMLEIVLILGGIVLAGILAKKTHPDYAFLPKK